MSPTPDISVPPGVDRDEVLAIGWTGCLDPELDESVLSLGFR